MQQKSTYLTVDRYKETVAFLLDRHVIPDLVCIVLPYLEEWIQNIEWINDAIVVDRYCHKPTLENLIEVQEKAKNKHEFQSIWTHPTTRISTTLLARLNSLPVMNQKVIDSPHIIFLYVQT